jgi:p-hydroxybenzoate 3-monooxygenase
MRSFVGEPLRHGRLFLAGDAAHIVPATGAKGLNLAVADVRVLAPRPGDFFAGGDESGLDAYSDRCLRRVLAGAALLVVDDRRCSTASRADPFEAKLQRSQLDYVVALEGAATDAGRRTTSGWSSRCLTACWRRGRARRRPVADEAWLRAMLAA